MARPYMDHGPACVRNALRSMGYKLRDCSLLWNELVKRAASPTQIRNDREDDFNVKAKGYGIQ